MAKSTAFVRLMTCARPACHGVDVVLVISGHHLDNDDVENFLLL